MPKNYWRPPRDYYDEEKLRKKRETLELVREILENTADENEFAEAVKNANPVVTPEELVDLIQLFRAYARETGGLG
jgi:hypothetical protein